MKTSKKIVAYFITLFAMIFLFGICTNENVQAASVKISKTSATLSVGDTLKLSVEGISSGNTVTWSSSNKGVATVSKKGVVTPKKKGNAVIKAKVKGKTYKCKIKVRSVYTISKSSPLKDVGSNLYSTYSSQYVNSYTRDWYLFRSYLEQLEKEGGGTLIVEKGTYNVTNTLCIPSNVNIIFKNGVTINKTSDTHTSKFSAGVTLFEFVPAAKYHTTNWCQKYNGVKNSKIIGKGTVTINLNYALYSVAFTMCHNQNIKISGISFKNVNESHFIELDASKNVVIKNCTFKNVKGSNTNREAINLDTPDDSTNGFSKPWAKNDKTPNVNVTISGCKFSNLYVAVGTHQYSTKNDKTVYHKNVKITDCTINKVSNYGIHGLAWKNVTITNNTIKNGGNIGFFGSNVVNPKITGNKFLNISNIAIRMNSLKCSSSADDFIKEALSQNIFKKCGTKTSIN